MRNTGYIGSSMLLTDSTSILSKKYICVIRNDNDFDISIALLLSCSENNWTTPGFATIIKSFTLNAGETHSIEIYGSDFSKITGNTKDTNAFVILKIVSDNDIGKEANIVYDCIESKNGFVTAENAGFNVGISHYQTIFSNSDTMIDATKLSKGFCSVKVNYETNSFDFTFTNPNNSYVNDTETSQRFWTYSFASIDIKKYLGKGQKY